MPRAASDSTTKAVVSVTEMARMCGLSRSHFHALVKSGVMPWPIYCLFTRRPMYTRELQAECLAVKASNIGIDGRYVVFYSPREESSTGGNPRPRRATAPPDAHESLIEGLRALGMAAITPAQVESALAQCFPAGVNGTDEGVVLRTAWQYLRRSNVA